MKNYFQIKDKKGRLLVNSNFATFAEASNCRSQFSRGRRMKACIKEVRKYSLEDSWADLGMVYHQCLSFHKEIGTNLINQTKQAYIQRGVSQIIANSVHKPLVISTK